MQDLAAFGARLHGVAAMSALQLGHLSMYVLLSVRSGYELRVSHIPYEPRVEKLCGPSFRGPLLGARCSLPMEYALPTSGPTA